VLSGGLDDGSMGLKEIKANGGLAIVQDLAEALHPDMPRNAMLAAKPDFCLRVSEMSSALPDLMKNGELLQHETVKRRSKDMGMKLENHRVKTVEEINKKLGSASVFVCPECNGPLWEINNGHASLYRCLVGHAYAPEEFAAAQSEELERSLWVALRTLEQRVELDQQMVARAKKFKQSFAAKHFMAKLREHVEDSKLIRRVLEMNGGRHKRWTGEAGNPPVHEPISNGSTR